MSDLSELYQEVILDHNRSPHNFGALDEATHHAVGHNPLCGDRITIYITLRDGIVEEVTFDGVGCAISKASASMMTDAVTGKSIADVEDLFATIHGMLTGTADTAPDPEQLGKLAALSGVCEYPIRVKCATLAWHTLKAALNGNDASITTE